MMWALKSLTSTTSLEVTITLYGSFFVPTVSSLTSGRVIAIVDYVKAIVVFEIIIASCSPKIVRVRSKVTIEENFTV